MPTGYHRACFSTQAIQLFNTQSLQCASSPLSSTSTPLETDVKSLVGVPCPGCGSPFQIDRPNDPGYLTRTSSNFEDPSLSKKKKSSTKQPDSSFGPKSTSMDHNQYEEHLKSLDPKLLQEMGILPPEPAVDSNNQSTTDHHSTQDKEEILSRKPTLTPTTPPRVVCHRCHSLSHHASPLANSSVLPSVLFPSPPAPVPKYLETLAQSKTATVVLVVDLIDFPLSLPKPIIDELLKAKKKKNHSTYPTTPIILVGNKFDVMPLGTRKHKVIQHLQHYLEKHHLAESVRAIHLVSAKNPVGDEIRLLMKSIGTSWSKSGKGNVVMVGAENSGRWRPNDQQAFQRKHGQEQQERQQKLGKLLGSQEDAKWSEMTGVDSVGVELNQYEHLYKERGVEKLSKYKTTVSNVPGTTLERIKVPLSVLSRLLTLDELKVTLPKKVLKPATFMLEEGKSFFLGGLVRIDCISIGKPIVQDTSDSSSDIDPTTRRRPRRSNPVPKITCFTTLPLHKTSTAAADKFLEKSQQGQLTVLQPPFGSDERLAAFPGLAPISDRDLVIINDPHPQPVDRSSLVKLDRFGDREEDEDPLAHLTRQQRENITMQLAGHYGICDLVFAGIGWVMVSGKFHGPQQPVQLRVWTPQGQGAAVRDVCLLPELAANLVDKTAGGIRQKQKLFQALPRPEEGSVEDVKSEEVQ
ncbi:hypothetical protein CPC16_006603 [Podila verticillata]|nr:hypothetical protein CPC16_006603 [Podila verticillata]